MIIPQPILKNLVSKGLTDTKDTTLTRPTSLIIRVGQTAAEEDTTGRLTKALTLGSRTTPYQLQAGSSMLLESLSTFTLPTDVAAMVSMLTERGVEGYMINTRWLPQGFTGKIALRVFNSQKREALPIWLGMQLAELTLFEVRWNIDGIPLVS